MSYYNTYVHMNNPYPMFEKYVTSWSFDQNPLKVFLSQIIIEMDKIKYFM